MDKNKDIIEAVKILREGGLIGLPTETVYGLAAAVNQELALKKVFELKERPFFDPLIVHISKLEHLKGVSSAWSGLHTLLANKFWPGPLTMVLAKSAELNSLICSGLETVAVRMPDHPIALEIIKQLDCAVAAPSANKFGKTSPTNFAHVRAEFPDLFILDGGPSKIGLESTVLELVEQENKVLVKIYRPGGVDPEAVRLALEEGGHAVELSFVESSKSPGHTKNHYQPELPLVVGRSALSETSRLDIIQKLSLQKDAKAIEIKLNDEAILAARELYSMLRSVSENKKASFIYLQHDHDKANEWLAIWDRLNRAASLILS